MPLYKNNNTKPQSLMSFLMQKQEEGAEIEKLNLNKLSKEVFGKLMHNDEVGEDTKLCVVNMLKKSNIHYNDLVTDNEFDGLEEEVQQTIIEAGTKKFTPTHIIRDEAYCDEEVKPNEQ